MNNLLQAGNGPLNAAETLPPAAPPQPPPTMAEPLHIQRLEAALDMRPFMEYARQVLRQPLGSEDSATESEHQSELDKSSDADASDYAAGGRQRRKRLLGTKQERQIVKTHIFNFKDLTIERDWLYNVLLSDTDSASEISDEDDYVKDLLKTYTREQRHRENFYKKATNSQFAYYGAGFLSNHDMHPEHQQSIVGVRRRRRRTKKEQPPKLPRLLKQEKTAAPPKIRKQRKSQPPVEQPEPGEINPADLKHYAFGETSAMNEDDEDEDADGGDEFDLETTSSSAVNIPASMLPYVSTRGRRRKSQLPRTPEVMAARRRKVWQLMAKKELGRCHRAKVNNHKEVVQNCKRVATMCMKVVRQRAAYSQKVMKETVWRAKRLTREMLSYWKRYERVERDTRRRMEREAEEQRKMDVELIEAKRQQRKLNFLITQTELYAHFMSKKLGQGTEEEQLRILNQLDEEVNPRLAAYDDYDAEHMKLLAQQNAALAFDTDRNKTHEFQLAAKLKKEREEAEAEAAAQELALMPIADVKDDLPQPHIFKGTLKAYQIKGMTWLANLYDQGISGILADEMGLGKTVQSIAFLCHIAETYGVWGPFLIISPASTLHNWQQEMQRFVPAFNVVPYWGSPNERKILRQFWEQKDLHTKDASFHVVITSYQLIVSDYKYFNRIKWQYMILDEAQAIKSATSTRWKLLLGFNCRNRLLLSGTPIQNSMAELWALLHFIMPTLFDSHDEFNEWFSKDIESHAENKTGIDEKQISRLHMILKPFMLRRIKKDVENELSDKIEIMVYCPLTIRQKLLYMALKKKIRIEDLLHLTGGGAGSSSGDGHHVDRNFTSNLMNLVMQFRKVCNHPELFERRDAKSPFAMRCEEYTMPRLVFEEALLVHAIPSKRHLLYNKLSIFKSENIQRSLFSEPSTNHIQKTSEQYSRYIDLNITSGCCFSFTRLCDFAPMELEAVTIGGLIKFLQSYRYLTTFYELLAYRRQWWAHYQPTRFQLLEPILENPLRNEVKSVLRNFVFTGITTSDSSFYTFGDYKTVNMQETIEHRVIRSKFCEKLASPVSHIEELDDINLFKKEEPDLDVVNCDDDSSSQTAATFMKSMRAEKPAKTQVKAKAGATTSSSLSSEFPYVPRAPTSYYCEPLEMPRFLYNLGQRVQAVNRRVYCESRAAEWAHIRHTHCENAVGLELLTSGLNLCKPRYGWSSIVIPDKQTLVSDAGKLAVLDSLLTRLKAQGHRVLIYSQMTKMIDLLEEYMWHRKHRYMRLDGSSKISARRDMVADFQSRADIFVFLLSTRAGGLGINLTAADTVIFYDSDWNPTVDQQAMDRAHRLGQTKQVTVYRLICKGTIEERILQRAREKSEIQRMVISGGNFKPDTLKPKEVVSLLLDDEEIELKYRQKSDEKKSNTDSTTTPSRETPANERKRKHQHKATTNTTAGGITIPAQITQTADDDIQNNPQLQIKQEFPASKRARLDATATHNIDDDSIDTSVSAFDASTYSANGNNNSNNNSEPFVPGATTVMSNDDSDNEALVVDCESPLRGAESPTLFGDYGSIGRIRRRHHPRGTKRGRPRGSRRGGGNGTLGRQQSSPVSGGSQTATPTTTAVNAEDTSTSPVASGTPLTNTGEGSFTPTALPTPMKRGPGRPRLKTGGPPNQGTRGAPRTRKPIGPLMVPLGHSPAATPHNRSPVISPAPSPAQSERSSLGAASGSKAE